MTYNKPVLTLVADATDLILGGPEGIEDNPFPPNNLQEVSSAVGLDD
jgi:hypothetical protein